MHDGRQSRLSYSVEQRHEPDQPRAPDAGEVAPYLRARGVIGDGPAEVVELGGGVSNLVVSVTRPGGAVVLKQALPRLRVAEEWLAKRERALAEARALGIARRLAPGSVPRVVDVDPVRCAIMIEVAPPGWRTWKEHLLDGDAAARGRAPAGRLWRLASGTMRAAATAVDGWDSFEQLRVDPYYREAAGAASRRSRRILDAGAMAERRTCLVHGDFSPKNVLVGEPAPG